ncbi:lactate racemase domain-containing protein [Gemmata sp.]|uniref:lactate racemase domain-containing protein n=1 Tax=Gemmata sp. TaxID=1914242 RepID=UPI003F6E6E82
MSQDLIVGSAAWLLSVPPARAVAVTHAPVAAQPASPAELTRAALDRPVGFEPLRRALTPDDRVTVVVDSGVAQVVPVVEAVLAYLRDAGVALGSVTLLTPPEVPADWAAALAVEFAPVRREAHDPADRKRLAYVGSTVDARRIYLNRTLADGDFTVVVSGRGYDPLAGYAGAECAIFPALGDAENRAAYQGQVSIDAPGEAPWPVREEATEVVALLGMPFFVQVIAGAGDAVQDVIGGLPTSSAEGVRRQDARWAGTVAEEPDTVVAAVSGDPAQTTFLDLAKALVCAARVAPQGSRIALLTAAAPELGAGAAMLRSMAAPSGAKRRLARLKPADWSAARLWAYVTRTYSVFLASGYPDDVAESLFTTPLHTPDEVQRLIDGGEKVLLVPDAHKTLLTLA